MKYNCTNEFDLALIYKKLTYQSTTQMVKACNFFEQEDMLTKFQKKMAQSLAVAKH
jgi:hypothetical protein